MSDFHPRPPSLFSVGAYSFKPRLPVRLLDLNVPHKGDLHELLDEVAITEKKVVFQRRKVVEQAILLEKNIEEPLARNLVCGIDGSL